MENIEELAESYLITSITLNMSGKWLLKKIDGFDLPKKKVEKLFEANSLILNKEYTVKLDSDEINQGESFKVYTSRGVYSTARVLGIDSASKDEITFTDFIGECYNLKKST